MSNLVLNLKNEGLSGLSLSGLSGVARLIHEKAHYAGFGISSQRFVQALVLQVFGHFGGWESVWHQQLTGVRRAYISEETIEAANSRMPGVSDMIFRSGGREPSSTTMISLRIRLSVFSQTSSSGGKRGVLVTPSQREDLQSKEQPRPFSRQIRPRTRRAARR